MRLGKLTNEQLKRLVFSRLKCRRNEVIVRPGVGEDCAVIDFAGSVCVASTDPITAASKGVGSLSVHVSCNDVASSGAEPVAMLVTLLIPPHCDEREVERVVDDIASAAASLNVDVAGGHTEVTDAVNRIVVSATVLGKAARNAVIKSAGARPGDALVMTAYAATEGTAVIANDHEQRLQGLLTPREIEEAQALDQSVSVVKEGLIAAASGVSAMHDVTEGGIIGAVCELCEASRCGAEIDLQKIPVRIVTKKICEGLGLDPYRLLSSGSMLMAAREPENLLVRLGKAGIHAAVIGRVTEKGVFVTDGGRRQEALPPLSDEILRLNR